MRDWVLHRFDEVFDLQMGKTPDRKTPQYFGGDNVWVSIRDMGNKEIIDSNEHITDEAVVATNIRKVKKGTVIMSFKLTVGKCAIAAKDLYTNEAIMAFNLKEGYDISADFLYYYLQGYKWEGANKAVMGLTLNKATISQHKIGFPSLSEQKFIVSELDKINELINLKKTQLSDIDKLAQNVFYEMFGHPLINEKEWKTKKYGECFTIGAGGTPSKSNPLYWDNGIIPWIGSNMCQNCIITETDGKYITSEGLKNSSAKMLDPGTVLVALVGATIGKVALLRICTSTNQNIAFIKVNENKLFCPEFVYYHLMNQYDEFMLIGNGDFKMANQAFIKSLTIMMPPISLQQEFAKRLKMIEQQKLLINSTVENLETLLASRMQYWFG